ncbi:MAG: tRNA (cytidine(34)-2'-O)-methyltransferase [Blastocatellia bacterium]|nr:tRNA (cytidine(34)-2'-O)-methyltransferase [Blastocatellia bacterium]
MTELLNIVLVEPEIHPNTGNIARLCAATATRLHLIEPLGFRVDDAAIKRAGLDYWPHVDLYKHVNLSSFEKTYQPASCWYFSSKASRSYTSVEYKWNDYLFFGSETSGLPSYLLQENWDRCLTIPMPAGKVRSLNLATSVSIVLYEALRQLGKI